MRILVIGAGAIGFQLCKQLAQHDHDIILVELDPRRARRAGEQLDALVVPGNGTSVRTLRSARIEQTDVVAAMTTNEEANLLACRLAKTLGAKSTIARVRNPEYTLPDYPLSNEELGVDLCLGPDVLDLVRVEVLASLLRRAVKERQELVPPLFLRDRGALQVGLRPANPL